ncbi:MAG: competence/damage-inducible protein A [Deltaproteobacteria bacterium]|nr:competence/damage-inducible protein A [Deltaproteobacteria bacterium]
MPETTAAIVVIGNEILSGKTEDTNSRFLIKELRELGVRVVRLVVVPDAVDEIAAVVRECSERCDHVFTSGGVGPTHDDVTLAGVARAFGVPLQRHPQLERVLREFYGERITERHLRMAEVPEGAELCGRGRWPALCCRNVYVLPGVPDLLHRKFTSLRERFRGDAFHLGEVFSSLDEGLLAAILEEVVAAFPDVEVGSYPRLAGTEWRVKITLESRDAARVKQARLALLERLPAESLLPPE